MHACVLRSALLRVGFQPSANCTLRLRFEQCSSILYVLPGLPGLPGRGAPRLAKAPGGRGPRWARRAVWVARCAAPRQPRAVPAASHSIRDPGAGPARHATPYTARFRRDDLLPTSTLATRAGILTNTLINIFIKCFLKSSRKITEYKVQNYYCGSNFCTGTDAHIPFTKLGNRAVAELRGPVWYSNPPIATGFRTS